MKTHISDRGNEADRRQRQSRPPNVRLAPNVAAEPFEKEDEGYLDEKQSSIEEYLGGEADLEFAHETSRIVGFQRDEASL